jgi:hypothetical protein
MYMLIIWAMSDTNPTFQNVPKESGQKTAERAKPGAAIERGGPKGPEPTRYGDWEKNGKCVDF